MRWLNRLWLRLRGLVWSDQRDRDLEDELNFHLEMRRRELESSGMDPGEARAATLRRFGNKSLVAERGRDLFGFGAVERFFMDVQHGWRVLRKTPSATLVAVFSLALGIGGNAAIYSVLYPILLQPPPYENPEELITVWSADLSRGRSQNMVAFADILDFEKQAHSFRGLGVAGLGAGEATMIAGESPEIVRWQFVSPNLFEVLGVKPVIGRDLNSPDLYRGFRGVLLSYDFWQRRFGGDPAVLSNPMTLNGRPVIVAGVMPKYFQAFSWGARGTDIWQSLDPGNPDQAARGIPWLLGVGRLAPGITAAQADAELNDLAKQLAQTYPQTNKDRGVVINSLSDWTRPARNILLPLAGAVAFVLLMACANVANLLLARAGARHKEFVVRAALGAGRWRLIRQLLTESILLAAIGGVVGLGIASLGVRIFQYLAPAWFPQYLDIGLNLPVLVFTFAVSLVAGILAGLTPAIQASRTDLNDSLKDGTRASFGRGRKRARFALVVVQVALALVLVIGAGLMVNSLTQVLRVRVGYDPSSVITMQIDFSGDQYVELIKGRVNAVRRIHPRVEVSYDRILERVRSLPGVESASLVTWLPQAGNSRGPRGRRLHLTGQDGAPQEQPSSLYNIISPDYFHTMRIPIIRGRALSAFDTQNAQWVAVINETAARRFWPNGDALGQLITALTTGSAEEERPRQIVGIVGDVRQHSLNREPMPEVYVAYAQQPPLYGDGWQALLHRNLVVRTAVDPEKLASHVRDEVASIDRSQPIYGLASMEKIISFSAGQWKFYVNFLSIFGLTALFLAAIGIYGVISYLISERTLEFGIRMAVGGTPRDIWRVVFRDAFSIVGIGLVAGLAASAALTPLIAQHLYLVKPNDPVTLLGAAAILCAVACVAIWNPARKATQIDPAKALRSS